MEERYTWYIKVLCMDGTEIFGKCELRGDNSKAAYGELINGNEFLPFCMVSKNGNASIAINSKNISAIFLYNNEHYAE